ncbi:hypothetical protein [Streptomyces sp. CA-111067]|uniref:hypothetical protein n=1 Tax=Streptomyces sp. CA-111067 TaxID=3240046 RepID=UPI003D985D17
MSLRVLRGTRVWGLAAWLLVAVAAAGAGMLLLAALGWALGHPHRGGDAAVRLVWCVLPVAAAVLLAVVVGRAQPAGRPRAGLAAVGLGRTAVVLLTATTSALVCAFGSAVALVAFLQLRGDLAGAPYRGKAAALLGGTRPLPLAGALTLLALVPLAAAVATAWTARVTPIPPRPAPSQDVPPPHPTSPSPANSRSWAARYTARLTGTPDPADAGTSNSSGWRTYFATRANRATQADAQDAPEAPRATDRAGTADGSAWRTFVEARANRTAQSDTPETLQATGGAGTADGSAWRTFVEARANRTAQSDAPETPQAADGSAWRTYFAERADSARQGSAEGASGAGGAGDPRSRTWRAHLAASAGNADGAKAADSRIWRTYLAGRAGQSGPQAGDGAHPGTSAESGRNAQGARPTTASASDRNVREARATSGTPNAGNRQGARATAGRSAAWVNGGSQQALFARFAGGLPGAAGEDGAAAPVAAPAPEVETGAGTAPGGLPWGVAFTAVGLAVEATAPRGGGFALPGGLGAAGFALLGGWMLTSIGMVLAGPGLVFACGRVLAAYRPGALRLLAGRALQEEAVRVGRPLGLLCATVTAGLGGYQLHRDGSGPLGPVTAFAAALIAVCVLATTVSALLDARRARARSTTTLRDLGATPALLRGAVALRATAVLAVLVPLTALIAGLASVPTAR